MPVPAAFWIRRLSPGDLDLTVTRAYLRRDMQVPGGYPPPFR
jgi:hypothetical protein